MELTDLQRIKKVVKWLIFSDYGENEKEIAELLGYKKSSFSQIMNGKVPISDKFIDKITSVDENINKVWVKNGNGEMLKKHKYYTTEPSDFSLVTEPNEGGYNKYISALEDKIKLLEENRLLSQEIKQLQERISRLELENTSIKSKPQDRAAG